jgi:hypothetical protein
MMMIGRQSSIRREGDYPSVADLKTILRPLKQTQENKDLVDELFQDFEGMSDDSLNLLCNRLRLPREDYTLRPSQHQGQIWVSPRVPHPLDVSAIVLVDLKTENNQAFVSGTLLDIDIYHLSGIIEPAIEVAYPNWDDEPRLERCLASWNDPLVVTDDDVDWCFRRSNVPREAYMGVDPRFPDLFQVGRVKDSLRISLNPRAEEIGRDHCFIIEFMLPPDDDEDSEVDDMPELELPEEAPVADNNNLDSDGEELPALVADFNIE